jgi:hypothetical protein
MPQASLATRTELDQSRRAPGGLLSVALAAPQGWERGVVVPFYGCGEPLVRDKCVRSTDEPLKPHISTFESFPIEQGSFCSTLSGIAVQEHAQRRLDATTEWAVGRQLATDGAGLDQPSLDDAAHLGTVDSIVSAVACLEQAAADMGFGEAVFLHAPPRAASFLANARLISNGLSPSGHPWVISAGYPSDGATADQVRLWATGTVWASVDGIQDMFDVDYRRNSDEAWARRLGIVAFDPCVNVSVDVTVGACPALPSS